MITYARNPSPNLYTISARGQSTFDGFSVHQPAGVSLEFDLEPATLWTYSGPKIRIVMIRAFETSGSSLPSTFSFTSKTSLASTYREENRKSICKLFSVTDSVQSLLRSKILCQYDTLNFMYLARCVC
ncbi:hypothetical protein AVEN_44742-1 [Araneus ventricosus]|uniref:Uncharacterized protein n=1 Tax=Araneus ventricosus TaxID=182803 RepID=A0A4Y2HQZ9_ARAVE|nr:hypothetical protein AVEN_44742-1 [Araneus ventricosus]